MGIFSMNLKKEKSTRQKTCQIVSEIGIFSQDPDPDPHFLRIRTGQKQADPGGSGSETLQYMYMQYILYILLHASIRLMDIWIDTKMNK